MFDSLLEVTPPGVAMQEWVPEEELGDPWPDDVDAWVQAVIDRVPVDVPLDAGWDGPSGFADREPGGWSAVELDTATADPAALSDATLVEAIVGFDRVASWAGARQARLLAELAARRPPDAVPNAERAGVASEYAPDEVGVALTLSRGTAAARLGMAQRLVSVLPATLVLWESGRIDLSKARAVHDATVVLPDELAAAVEARVLPRAPGQSLAQLRAALARAVMAVDPAGADERHRQARRDRRVCIRTEDEGMASLWALLSATDAAGAFEWLTRLARGLGPDDPRTLDARRADLLAELLNGRLVAGADITGIDDDALSRGGEDPQPDAGRGETREMGGGTAATGATGGDRPAAPGIALRPVTPGKPLIQIVISHSTLTGADDQPAELLGHGPIPAALARDTAADAVWRRLVTDPLSGTVLDYGRSTYHPPAGLADHVRIRDRYCRFPLCRRKAADAELDHARAWADGGTTSAENLHALCLHHHKLKHHSRWRIETHPDGRLTWTTPTGRRYTTAPHDHRPDSGPALGPGLPAYNRGDDPPPF